MTFTVTASFTNEEVTVSFTDSGEGISGEDLKNVFEPFFTRKRSGRGTGLGLWISHSVIEEHHGRLEVHSAPGQGTTVSVTLPTLTDDAPRSGGSE